VRHFGASTVGLPNQGWTLATARRRPAVTPRSNREAATAALGGARAHVSRPSPHTPTPCERRPQSTAIRRPPLAAPSRLIGIPHRGHQHRVGMADPLAPPWNEVRRRQRAHWLLQAPRARWRRRGACMAPCPTCRARRPPSAAPQCARADAVGRRCVLSAAMPGAAARRRFSPG
jgi:hypothetical protein